MKDLIKKLTRQSGLIMIIAFACAALFTLIAGCGDLGGAFFPTVGSLISLVITVALMAAIPVLVLLKRDDLIGSLSFIIVGYFLITLILRFLSGTWLIVKGMNAIGIFYGIFEFLGALALIAAVVLIALAFLGKKDKMKEIAAYAFLVFLCIMVFAFIFGIIWFIVANKKYYYGYDWTSYFDLIVNTLCLPAAISFFAMPYLIETAGADNDNAEEKETAEEPEAPVEEKTE